MVKTVLYFIGLKIVEISGVFVSWYLLCKLGYFIEVILMKVKHPLPFWLEGLVPLLLIGISFFIGLFVWEILKANWKKAKKLANK